MKKLAILLGLVLLAGIALSEPIWVRDGSGISGSFRDVQMLDDSTGWAVGDAGVIYKRSGKLYPTSTEQVWYSQTNKIPSQTSYNFKSVAFADANNGWIVGYKSASPGKYKGIILKTTNGGTNWTAINSADPGLFGGTSDSLTPFLKVKMTYYGGAYNGYISCGNGYILKWTPGTNQWLKLRPTTTNSDSLTIWYNSLWMDETNPNSLWVAGDQSCSFLQSGNGGASWYAVQNTGFNQSYTFPANTWLEYQTQVAPLGMDVNGGIMYTGMSEGLIGQYSGSWSLLPTLGRDNWNYGIFTDLSKGFYTCGNNGAIRTLGSTPRIENEEKGRNYFDINFPSADNGYVVGSSKIVHRYEPVVQPNVSVERIDSIHVVINWTPQKEENLYKYITRITNIYGYQVFQGTGSLAGQAAYSDTYNIWAPGTHPSISPYTTYKWIWLAAQTKEGAEIWFGPWRVEQEVQYVQPLPPATVNAYDNPGDQGHKIIVKFSNPDSHGVCVARSNNIDGPYKDITRADAFLDKATFIDSLVPLNSVPYYYKIQFITPAYSDTSHTAIGVAYDNMAPGILAAPVAYYNASDSVLTLNWGASAATDLGGYWICPEPVGAFASKPSSKYTVNHAAPIERTTWSYRVPDYLIGQTLQMHVTAMDRSGNIGDWSPFVQINTKAFTNSNYALATAYNNGRHLLYDNNGKLHLTYTSVDSVFYQNSIDDGYTWCMPSAYLVPGGFAAGGINPSSVVGIYGDDTTITWKAETPVGGWVLKTAKRDNSTNSKWTEPTTILEQGSWYEQGHTVTPPAMVVNSAGTHLAIERRDMQTIPGGQVGFWDWKLLYGFKPVGSSIFTWTVLDTASGSWDNTWPNACPTICIDSKGGIHVAWDYEGEVYWKVYDPYTSAWKNKINLSYSPEVVSAEPSLAFYGDVHLVWQEGNDIYHNKGNWGLPLAVKSKIIGTRFSWQGSENVNPNSSGTASLNPVFDGNYIAWNEATDDGLYKASYANFVDFAWNIEPDYSKNPTQPSVYPQIAYRQNADGNKMTTVWTEGTGPLYSLIARDSAGQVTAALAADVGGVEPSIYTIERDGYLIYSATKSTGITVDYDSTALEYYLPTLDREQKQTVKISLYQEYADKADYIYHIWVDNVSLGAVKVPSGQMVTFEKDLPNAVSHDGEGVLKIVNLKKGAIVTCDKYELFAYDKATGRKNSSGGAQTNMSEARPVAYRYELMQNAPNPCSKQTTINYQLAKQGQVSLKVYNTLGQVVKTLVNESQNPGSYSVKWNGNDEAGRQSAAGIYFYRLASGEFNSTKKMVVLR